MDKFSSISAIKDAIGKNSKGKDLYTIKVVIDEYGNVVTAFPIKWWGEYNEFLYWKFS